MVDDEIRKRVRPNGGRSIPPPDRIFYHWSPTSKRNRILRGGLKIGSKNLANEWKPPYVCFSDDPYLAWVLSGNLYPEIQNWDLWMVHSWETEGFEAILEMNLETKRHFIKEYRVYVSIPKKHVHYIASRSGGKIHKGILLP